MITTTIYCSGCRLEKHKKKNLFTSNIQKDAIQQVCYNFWQTRLLSNRIRWAAAVHTVMWSSTDVVWLKKYWQNKGQFDEIATHWKNIFNVVLAELQWNFWGFSCFRWRNLALVLSLLSAAVSLAPHENSTCFSKERVLWLLPTAGKVLTTQPHFKKTKLSLKL